jgi:hypothetical protein
MFCPKFHNKANRKDIKKGQYFHHVLPTGARPVPAEDEQKREKAGWSFHIDPFPDCQKGNLDYDLLKHMDLTKATLEQHDAFFFFSVAFPICDLAKSGITDNPRMPFYSKVENWSQKYATTGGSYSHKYFDMAVV